MTAQRQDRRQGGFLSRAVTTRIERSRGRKKGPHRLGSVLLVFVGTVLAAIQAFKFLRMTESVTLPTGALAVITLGADERAVPDGLAGHASPGSHQMTSKTTTTSRYFSWLLVV